MDSTEALLKQITLGSSGGERWSKLVDFYEVKAWETLGLLQTVSERVALQPGVAGRPLIEVADHIGKWDDWEINAGLSPVASGILKPPIMEFKNFVNREGKVVHYDHLSMNQAIDKFNQDRANELRLFMQHRGLTWQKVVEELGQTSRRFAAAARNIPAEVADQTEPHWWKVLGESVPHAVFLVAISALHIALDGEHQADFDRAARLNR